MTDIPSLKHKLWRLNQELSRHLWELPIAGAPPREHFSRLVIPAYREETDVEGKPRISEQEARFLCCGLLEHSNCFFYSVETPTTERYSFSGEGDCSARSDVSLYLPEAGGYDKVVNIEFKAEADNDFETVPVVN